MGKFHPLAVYFLVGLITFAYLSYIAYYTVFRRNMAFLFQYAFTNHAISILLSILAVITGFSQANDPYIQQKAPLFYLLPHNLFGILLAVYTLVSFPIFWIKRDDTQWKLGAVLGLVGLGLTIITLIFGWLLRLMFF